MSLQVGWFSFDGPFMDSDDLRDMPGIFVVISLKNDNEILMLDIDQGESICDDVKNHERLKCWHENSWGKLAYLAYYPPELDEEGRISIVTEIRMQYELPCGKKVDTKPYGEPKKW